MKSVLFAASVVCMFGADNFTWRESSPQSIELLEDGVPVFAYNFGMIHKEGVPAELARSSYIHPLYAPNGAVLTGDFPYGHLHHRGVSWMWPVVKVDGVRYDLWLLKGVHQEFVQWIKKDPGLLVVENVWVANGKKIVKEIVEVRARKTKNMTRDLEFKLSFEAIDKPVTLEGEPTDKKGSGGFTVRFADRQHTAIRTQNSANEPDSDMKVREWAELVGDFGDKHGGIRISIDKSNPGFPNGWQMRKYGFLGVCYPGNGSVELVHGKPLVLRYKLTVFAAHP